MSIDQAVARFAGQVERVSPVVYAPSTELLRALVENLRGLQSR